jgi:dTDP-4-dehydrorhamnose reductase
MNKKVALLGPNGFLGKKFKLFFQNQKVNLISVDRKTCDLTNINNLFAFLKTLKPDYIINCAGYTGKPNVDACEKNKEKCWISNVTIPRYLSEVCNSLSIKYIQISSGCVYSGSKWKNGFKESDEPNFSFDKPPCSYYSGTKAVMESLLSKDKYAYICRLRIPFNEIPNHKNYITKLINYDTLLNAQNSLSNIDEFISACQYLVDKECETGIYNITNTGSITTKEAVKYINKYITDKKFKFFKNDEEFYSTAAITPRSNCVLDNKKLRDTGFKIKDIHQSFELAAKNYIKI